MIPPSSTHEAFHSDSPFHLDSASFLLGLELIPYRFFVRPALFPRCYFYIAIDLAPRWQSAVKLCLWGHGTSQVMPLGMG